MVDTWRLIVNGPLEGVANMAYDRAIQLSRERGSGPPTLRLYRWARPTVTLGRFQSVASVDPAVCDRLGIDVVRRFTGGRGVLHDDELTYSVAASTADGVPRGVAASYRYLSEALAEAYRLLGVEASVTERDRVHSASAACYLATTRADLSLGAMKLSGSAQVWSGSTVLQHGSFTLSRDIEREAQVFGLSPEETVLLGEKTSTIHDALGRRPPLSEIEHAVSAAFETVLGISLTAGGLSEEEIGIARSLEPDIRVSP